MTESIWKRGPAPWLDMLDSYREHLPPPEGKCVKVYPFFFLLSFPSVEKLVVNFGADPDFAVSLFLCLVALCQHVRIMRVRETQLFLGPGGDSRLGARMNIQLCIWRRA